MAESIGRHVERLAEAHGVSGYTSFPDGTVVYAAYRDGEYELCTQDGQLTDTKGDVTSPQWLTGRESILALRDRDGNEQHDLIEVNPDTGESTPILDDEFLNFKPHQNPVDTNQVAFLSNRDRSLDLYIIDIEAETIEKQSDTDETVMGYAWSPSGESLVYQTGLVEGSSLHLVDITAGTDEALIDEPDSEQSLSYMGDGHNAWSEDGIVFTTNHETGYRELAVADRSGEYDLRLTTERDKYDPHWTDDGDIVFLESQGGSHVLCRLTDDGVTTIEEIGLNMDIQSTVDSVWYIHQSPDTAGTLKRDGEPIVEEGAVDIPTVMPREVTYESFDGQTIAARLYTPDEEPVAGIVKPHGGPPSQHFTRLDLITQTLVQAGFEVLAPDFRGSTGYGRGFRKASDGDLGGDDLQDVVAGAEYLRERGHAQIGITGASYGGYMTLMGIGATDAFDAGASVCGIVNWNTTYEKGRQYLGDYLIRKLGGLPDENPDLYEDRSPITYVDEMSDPLLIVQGANDPRVVQEEADQLVSSLCERDVPHEYLLFEDEGHSVTRTENRVEYAKRVVGFFEEQL